MSNTVRNILVYTQSSLFFNGLVRVLLCAPYNGGVVAQWCDPLTLQPEQSGKVGSIPGRASPLERHDKVSWTRLTLRHFCDPNAWG